MAKSGGTGEAKVGGKEHAFNRFAAVAGQSRDEPYCKQLNGMQVPKCLKIVGPATTQLERL